MTPEMIHAFQRDRKLVLTEKAVRFKTVRRLTIEASPHTIDSQERAIEFLSDLFEQRPTEALYAIALNSCNDFLGLILLSNGSVDRATVYPRELVSFLLHETKRHRGNHRPQPSRRTRGSQPSGHLPDQASSEGHGASGGSPAGPPHLQCRQTGDPSALDFP